MWPNNGFREQENFEHNELNLYQGQGSYLQPFREDGYIPFSPVPFTPPYFLQQPHSQGMQYNPPLAGSVQSTPGEYEPQIDFYNTGAVIQNDFSSSDDPEKYAQFRQAMASHGSVRPALNARAEELKAQLMKIKERGKSRTPVPIPVSNPFRSKEAIAPPQESSKISLDDTATIVPNPSGVIEEDLNNLISEAKAAAHIEKGKIQSDLNTARRPQPSSSQPENKYTVAVVEESSPKATKQATNNSNSPENPFLKMMNTFSNDEVLSDVSEGEIPDRSTADTSRPPSGPKEPWISTKQNKENGQVLRKSRNKDRGEIRRSHENRETSPHRGGANQASAPQFHDNRNDKTDDRPMKNIYASNSRYERNHQAEGDHRLYLKRDTRESNEKLGKQQSKDNSNREEQVARKSEAPTLAQLLTLDEDLRDWLDITRYHDVEYRTKTLNRRRAIAALDAQKAKLLAEMEMEERGGLHTTTNSQIAVSSILPPSITSKMGTNMSSSVDARPSKKDDDLPIPPRHEQSSSTSISQEMALKRTYSEYRESQDKVSADKIGRVDEQGRGIGIKSEHQTEEKRRSGGGFNSTRCRSRSISPDHKSGSRGKRDTHSRNRQRSLSHHRETSPSGFAHEKKPRARSRSYEFPSPEEQNRNIWKNPEYVPRGTYVERGNYRGRAFDPKYRGRGGGRGRGKTWNELGEARNEQRDAGQIQSHGNRLASLKPYKDPHPLDKGGKGATRYFIVKSFNEENVVRCIEDSIWTTKIENGTLFNSAFLKCKNVIFVFSVNQSRAFQGYARMESSPGTEIAPPWMNSINWESAGAFKVRWLCVANTRFSRVGHLKNRLNEDQPVLVGRDGQEIEGDCGDELLKLIDEEADRLLARGSPDPVPTLWDD